MGISEVKELIGCLCDLKAENSPLLTSISNYNLLIEALNELDGMIEMDEVKSSIVSQIKFLLINTVFNADQRDQRDKRNKEIFEGHMLHTVLYGSPGTGKSAVGVILAKIWTSLGLLKKPNTANNPNNPNSVPLPPPYKKTKREDMEKQIANLTSSGKIKSDIVKKLQERILEMKYNLKDVNMKMNLFRIRSLKRELEKIKTKEFSYINCLNLLEEIIKEEENSKEVIEEVMNSTVMEENIQFTIGVQINKKHDLLDEIIEEIHKMGPPGPPPPLSVLNKDPELEPKKFDMIRIVSREDFVGGYLGQTAIKTEKLLRDSIGKVLFIDEAYSLINDDKDSYGYECLTTLNRFMSEHSSEIVIIFAGYKDMMENTIFKAQPGLKRRCTWHFEIKGYSEYGLSKIFESQLNDNGWELEDDIDLISFFKENLKEFPFYGGDTLRLAFYSKICYSNEVFDNKYPNQKVINKKILDKAFEYLKLYRIKEEVESVGHKMMYL